ncbi:NADPH dehydrogenase [Malassezia yamatoensis]|uniref:NADPH dehydrogenase n=1 Tax=Malassezia yamatoensis TaxID=253288 RepID=A0AAJ5YZ25_9BASI|nr:NADPH dehydrogenase [Malassezia yamatoensis]
MADVWISRKRWTCKYCNVTINDDVPSRQHHESGMRHKNNVARSLRGLYKDNQLQRQEEAQHARELAQIEQAAEKSHRYQDLPRSAREKQAKVYAPTPQAWKPADKLASYTSAKALGISEDDEQAWQATFALRKGAADVGEWEPVENLVDPSDARPAKEFNADQLVEQASCLRTERQKAREFALEERQLNDEQTDDLQDLPAVVLKRPRTQIKHEDREELSVPSTHTVQSTDSNIKLEPESPNTCPGNQQDQDQDQDHTTLFRKRKARRQDLKKTRSESFA